MRNLITVFAYGILAIVLAVNAAQKEKPAGSYTVLPEVRDAVSWAIETANNSSHGYDRNDRWGPDYDCSSFVISAYQNAGIDTGNAAYTGNMFSELTQHGFTAYPFQRSELQYGDILFWRDSKNETGHTELFIGNHRLVGARMNENGKPTDGISGDQTGEEISVTAFYHGGWKSILRYEPTD